MDYESIQSNGKTKLHQKYVPFYVEKMDALYKSILKNYSVQLSDNIHTNLQYRNQIFLKIFDTLDEYVSQIIPIKREICQSDELKVLNREYGKYEKFTVGKLDEKDCIEKNVVLLGISRELFTHSLPLVVAEQCYLNLINQIRDLMVEAKTTAKQEEEYKMLIEVLDEYNMKLLSTKIYWSNPNEREAYKNFWDQYNKAKDQTEKEILSQGLRCKLPHKNAHSDFRVCKKVKSKAKAFYRRKYEKNSFCNFRTFCNFPVNFRSSNSVQRNSRRKLDRP